MFAEQYDDGILYSVYTKEKSPPTRIPVEGFFKYDFLVAWVGFEPTTFGL